jgi:2-pyrone-4,6-dicarboxylate lactonase
MHDAGVRGVRFNYVKRLVDPKPDEYYQAIISKIKRYGWHVVIYFEAADLDSKLDFFSSLSRQLPLVVDHMGRPDTSLPASGPEFAKFLEFMERNENVWCKVTCSDRLSKAGPPDYEDFVPFAKMVVDRFPERCLWGTDWPHPNLKSHVPDDGKLVDVVPRIAVGEDKQRLLLVENPMRLYWPEGSRRLRC